MLCGAADLAIPASVSETLDWMLCQVGSPRVPLQTSRSLRIVPDSDQPSHKANQESVSPHLD